MSSSTGTIVFDDAKLQAVDVIATGNIGIGKALPAYRLDVLGDINLSGTIYQNGVPFSGGGGGSSVWSVLNSNIYYNSGNVGIGTSTPEYTLDIYGNANAHSITTNTLYLEDFVISSSHGLDHVTNENNSTGDTIISTNDTTGFQASSNVVVGGDIHLSGNIYQNGTIFSGGGGGSLSTFLTWDYLGTKSTTIGAAGSGGTAASILDHEFDIPSIYNDLGTTTLKAYVSVNWRGELQTPWNFVFKLKVYYNDYSSTYTLDSSTSEENSTNTRGCGVPAISYYDNDFNSTLESASVTSQFTLPDCIVSNGSKIKVELIGVNGDSGLSVTVYTGRTKANTPNNSFFELAISSFFVALDVV